MPKRKITNQMRAWIADYIRTHRTDGYIGIHVVYSKLNENFRRTFGEDPRQVLNDLKKEGFLLSKPVRGGACIWLPEDAKEREKQLADETANNVNELESPTPVPAQEGPQEYAFEQIPHPETGAVDVVALLRYIVHHLDQHTPLAPTENPEDYGHYTLHTVSLSEELKKCGIENSKRPPLMQIMQEMAVVCYFRRGLWGVLKTELAEGFMTPALYNRAREKFLKEKRQNAVKRKKHVKPTLQQTEQGDVNFEEEAVAAVARAEELAEELKAARQRIGELEAELATRSVSDATAVKAALSERIAALKKQS